MKPEDILTKKYAQIVNLCLFQNRVGIGLHPALGLYICLFFQLLKSIDLRWKCCAKRIVVDLFVKFARASHVT